MLTISQAPSHLTLRPILVMAIFLASILIFPLQSEGGSGERQANYSLNTIGYEHHLNPLFKRTERQTTKYIIVHTSEADLETTLKIVSVGKQDGANWISRGGHAHYVVDRLGAIYKILDEKYRANHAGLSMWKGETDINSVSVGIELVAYHNGEITDSQYRSVGHLIKALEKKYHLDDLSVLTHSQVAYAKPNEWVAYNHRGRKNCARNFSRAKAGFGPTSPYDPDVKAGRLLPDEQLTAIYYPESFQFKRVELAGVYESRMAVMGIAGESYNSPDTIYQLPSGFFISGNRVNEKIGWDSLPEGTIIYAFTSVE